MNRYQRVVVNCLTHLLDPRKETNIGQVDHEELKHILEIAKVQGVGALVFPLLYKHCKEYGLWNEDWQRLRDVVLDIALKNSIYIKQTEALIHWFDQGNIPVMVLKGIAIGRLYPNPEYRLMSDVDIYVRPTDWEAARNLLVNNGYVQAEADDYNVLHVAFRKANAITVELHRNLIHTDYLGQREKDDWYKGFWDRKRQVSLKNMTFCAMSVEDEFIHQVTHFSAHFVYHGVKVKHLFDMALITKAGGEHFDWEYVTTNLKTLGFLEFARLLLSVCKKYFGTVIPPDWEWLDDHEVEQFMELLLNHFSYERKKGDFDSWVRVMNRVKPHYDAKWLQLTIWLQVAKAQYKAHRFHIPTAIESWFQNVVVANEKIRIIRRFGLSGSGTRASSD